MKQFAVAIVTSIDSTDVRLSITTGESMEEVRTYLEEEYEEWDESDRPMILIVEVPAMGQHASAYETNG